MLNIKIRKWLFLLLLIFAGCEIDNTDYSNIPELEYRSSEVRIGYNTLGSPSYLIKLGFYFIDGDGDVGLYEGMGWPYVGDSAINFFSEVHYIENGISYVADSVNGNYTIPYIDNLGLYKTLKAFLYVDFEYQNIAYDSIFYSCYIVDRAFNISNEVYTDTLFLEGLK